MDINDSKIPPSEKSNIEKESENSIGRKSVYIGLIVLLVAFTSSIIFLIWKDKPEKEANQNTSYSIPSPEAVTQIPSPTPSPTPTPKPLPKGKQLYRFSHGKGLQGPKPTTAVIDPIDPALGSEQVLTVTIPHANPLISPSIIVKTDKVEQKVELNQTTSSEAVDTWVAKWKMNDSYNHRYEIDFSLADSTGIFKGGLTFR